MNRIVLATLCIVLAGTSSAAEPLLACRDSLIPPQYRPSARDLTGALPIPDYLDLVAECNQPWERYNGPAILPYPSSAWIDSDRSLYQGVLARRKADVLVVPFQIQGFGLDRIERALMSADLAFELGRATNSSIADPFLVSRALGEGARRADPSAVFNLATRLGVRKILTAYVGHDGHHRFTLTIQVKEFGDASRSTGHDWQKDWRAVLFTDERPPALVLHEMLPRIVRDLPFEFMSAKPRPTSGAGFAMPRAIGAPIDVVTARVQPASAPAILNLLGALSASAAEFSRERLFERALLASLDLNAKDAWARFFEAYALMNLERRPAALAQLESLHDPAANTLRGLLNGDLPATAKSINGVKDPLAKLLLQFSLRDLQLTYGKKTRVEPMSDERVFGASSSAWQSLVAMRAGDADHWFVGEPLRLKKILDDAFPLPGMDAKSLVVGSAVARSNLPDAVELDIAIARHVRKTAASLEVDACCNSDNPRPTRWDLLWLLEGLGEGRMSKSLNRMSAIQGLPATAIADLDRYEAFFSGHPLLSLARANAALKIGRDSPDDERATWLAQSRRGAELAAYFARGQSRLSALALSLTGVGASIPPSSSSLIADGYGYDYPRRSFWFNWFVGFNSSLDQRAAVALEALAYSRDDVQPVFSVIMVEKPGLYDAIASELGSRFAGNPQRSQLPATSTRKASAPPPDPVAKLRAAIKNDPSEWQNYLDLGTAIIQASGDYSEASKVFLSYPEFRKQNPIEPVELSNDAYGAGNIFFSQGKSDLAKPLYQIAADLDTGSGATMSSKQRLLILAGNYKDAADQSLEIAIRYAQAYAYRDYLSLLHVLGRSDEAWAGFSQVMAAFDLPQTWVSALVGQRMQGMDETALRVWLMKPEIRGAKFHSHQFTQYYAILWNATDRMPPADLGAMIEQIEGPPVAHIDSGRFLLRPAPGDDTHYVLVRPSPFRFDKTSSLPEGAAVKSDLAFFADAYTALRHGEYDKAVQKFVAMADRYPVEGFGGSYALPYFAYAAAKTGDAIGFEKYVNSLNRNADFDGLLARAYFAGVRKDTATARAALQAAFRVRPHSDDRPILTEYQYAEACEWILRETEDPQFRTMLLDWVGAHQRIQPTHAWAYAIQYTYEKSAAERLRALAMTYYLDPASERIKTATPLELDQAEQWFRDHNPFKVQDRTSPAHSTW